MQALSTPSVDPVYPGHLLFLLIIVMDIVVYFVIQAEKQPVNPVLIVNRPAILLNCGKLNTVYVFSTSENSQYLHKNAG